MQPSDLEKLVTLEDVAVAPDGRVAVVESRVELDEDRYRRHIVVVDDDRHVVLTQGPGDRRPRWSPDGRRLAFLRTKEGGKIPQVAVIAVDGGEARVLSDFPLGAIDVAWSPDGRRLVAVGAGWADGWDVDEETRGKQPRRITSVPYRADNIGWIHDRRFQLWELDPDGDREPRRLTEGDYHETQPVFSPDGSRVAFLSDRTDRKLGSTATQVCEVHVEDGDVTVAAGLGLWSAVGYRPDGVLHAVGVPDEASWPAPIVLWRNDQGGWTQVAEHLDRSAPLDLTEFSWAGDDALLSIMDRGRVLLVRIEPDGTIHHVVDEEAVVTSYGSAGSADGAIVYVSTTGQDPGELAAVDGDRPLSDVNATFRAEVPTVAGEHFLAISAGLEIDAWAFLPDGDGPVPLLINIHGGPASQYGYGFFDEFTVYAAAGFGVVACNPRGSAGRGRDFLKSVTGDGWGDVDRADVEAVVAAALERYPRLDPERIGIMGGSYGGFLTAWMTAQDGRYRSAVVERALLSWNSFAGTSDIGSTFPNSYLSAVPPAGHDRLWKASPLSIADRITTPTLIIHAETDHRCPIEQAEQLFMALLRVGTETELLRFPGEGHEMSRSGSPRHRVERFEAILDWHRRHLLAPDRENLAN